MKRKRRPRATVAGAALAALAVAALACGARPARLPLATSHRAPVAILTPAEHARWVPESVEGDDVTTVQTLPDGTRRVIMRRLRVEASPDGSLRRARSLLVGGSAGARSTYVAPTALALPDRLGGGFVFASAGGEGTQIWRARDFLADPVPLARVRVSGAQVVAGPDRLVVLGKASSPSAPDKVVGIDLNAAAVIAPPPLPDAPHLVELLYADAVRGVAYADLLGLVATRDAGATWRPLGVTTLPRNVRVVDESFVMQVGSDRVTVDARGVVLRDEGGGLETAGNDTGRHRPEGPFGPHPLRAAVEDGWPLTDGSSVVMRAGRVGRVRLDDGALVELAPAKTLGEEGTRCEAVRYGVDVGFVCGAPGRGTTVYALTQPLGVAPVASFFEPRAVMPAGNGALVVRGGCDPQGDDAPRATTRSYCILPADGGPPRAVNTRGDVGVERVVALSDGRVAVLVPPRGGDPGSLTFVGRPGAPAAPSRALTLAVDERTAAALGRGLWLDGVIEVEGGELAAWVEGGGTLVGVRIGLVDGVVTAGKPRDSRDVIVSGRYALTPFEAERAWETVDAGRTWHAVDVPAFLGRRATRSCGVVGCVFDFATGSQSESWERVGWGPSAQAGDLEDVTGSTTLTSVSVVPSVMHLTCEGAPHGPPAAGPTRPTNAPAKGSHGTKKTPPSPPDATLREGAWAGFHGVAPPPRPAGFAGFDIDTPTPAGSIHLYAWAPRGAGHAGRLLARFFDRFDAGAGVRSTSVAVAPWPDAQATADALGFGANTVYFSGIVDVSGHAALLSACPSGGGHCSLFGLVEGRGVERLADLDEAPAARLNTGSISVLWSDEAWFIAANDGLTVTVWRFDANRARVLARLPRSSSSGSSAEPLRLVRRAHGHGVGLFGPGLGTFGISDRDLYVLPIDPETGIASDVVRLGPHDFGGALPGACTADDDGWLVDLLPPLSPMVDARAPVRLADVELRMRLESGRACVEALSAHFEPVVDKKGRPQTAPAPAPPGKPERPAQAAVPLVAYATAQNQPTSRLTALCHAR